MLEPDMSRGTLTIWVFLWSSMVSHSALSLKSVGYAAWLNLLARKRKTALHSQISAPESESVSAGMQCCRRWRGGRSDSRQRKHAMSPWG